MLSALDLTQRQASRLLEQAIRTRARLNIEAQSHQVGSGFRGVLVAREGNVLTVELFPRVEGVPPISLIGSFCEVGSQMAGELFFFTSCVLDVIEAGGPTRLLLSMPELIQVANRRRFERTNTTVASHVRLVQQNRPQAATGLMANISATGLAFTLGVTECEDPVLLGDDVRVQFELAGFDETFELPAVICNKHVSADRQRLLVGLEFAVKDDDLVARHTLARVHAMLNEMMSESSSLEGEA